MAGAGAPHRATPRLPHIRVAVLAATWHEEAMGGLVNGARRALDESGATYDVFRVPGSFELTVASARAARAGWDGVVALGVVIRGETPHFDYVCQAATDGLTQVSVITGVPVGFGVLTCDDVAQALDRAGLPGSREDKGYEAVQAVLCTLETLNAIEAGASAARVGE